MKIENIKLLRFISKKTSTINIIASTRNSLSIIDPKTILMKVFSFLFRLILADNMPPRKLNVVIIKARVIETN